MTHQSTDPALPARTPEQKSQWRQVLGRYPTGITIITSTNQRGEPVGMVVGTFSSISEEPPLIGFMPQHSSYTFSEIRQTGRFRASVLSADHEQFCRDFFAGPAEARFASDSWEYGEHGIPRLTDAVAWFDATIHDILPAGDHAIVLGEVSDLGLGAPISNVPLVFLNGGYGSFSTPDRGFDPDKFGGRLRVANQVSGLVRQLSMELGVECAMSTLVEDDVVVLTAADIRSPYVGTTFPFAAPMDPGFATWSSTDVRERWLENGRRLTGRSDDHLISDIIDLTRAQGYAISFGQTVDDMFRTVLSSARADRAAFVQTWDALEAAYAAYARDPRPDAHASAIQVPIFGPDGHAVFELVVTALSTKNDPARFHAIASTCCSYGRQITKMIGGHVPADYVDE